MAGLKKLLKRHGGKKRSASKEDMGSVSEMAAFGYVISKEKELPKLHKAVWNGDVAKVKQLCKKADINQFDKENRTPLHFASACGHEEITQFLLVNKAKTNLCDNDGRTALMKAVECSHIGCIELLLEHNADVKVTDKNSSSPLHLAAANNLVDVATRLLEKGLSINISDKEGFTALHVASSLGNQDFVLYLLNRGANVNSIDACGRTPLMTAAADGYDDIVKMLLQNKADGNLKDSQGWKAADHAVMNGIHSCANIIDDYEAKQAQERVKEKKETPNAKKKPNINEVLRASSPSNEDLGFSFGGPAADKVSVDVNLKSEGSTSRQSDADDTWASSSGDENSEIMNKKSTKVSLAAALKKVDKSVSEISDKSQSRIPVRSQVKSPISASGVPSPERVKSPQSPSKIPRPVSSKSPTPEGHHSSDVSQSQSPRNITAVQKQQLSPTVSVKSTGSASPQSSPRNTKASTSPQVRSPIISPSESMKSVGSGMHGRISRRESGGSLPMEYLKATQENPDSDQSSKNKVDQALGTGYSPSFLSPPSDRSNRNLADELGLSSHSSGEENDDDDDLDSTMSGEIALDNADNKTTKPSEKPKVLTSTAKADESQSKEAKNPAAYLGLDLDSSISSVSDPDISGLSDHKLQNEKTNKKAKTDDVEPQPSKPKENNFSEDTDSNWDSSEGFLPSDNENVSGKVSSKPSIKSNHDKELQAAVNKRRKVLDKNENIESNPDKSIPSGDESMLEEDGSEITESESECAREREDLRKKELEKIKESAMEKMKLEENRKKEVEEKLRLEMEKQREEEQMKKERREEETRLEKLKQKEEEDALIEMEKQKEKARLLEWEKQQQQKELELAESIKKELEEELGIESGNEESEEEEESYSKERSDGDSVNKNKLPNASGDFEEQGSSKWDSTDDERLNNGGVSADDQEVSEGSLVTEGTLEDERLSEAKFEKQMELKEKEKIQNLLNNNENNNINAPVLVQEQIFVTESSLDNTLSAMRDTEDVHGYTGQRGPSRDKQRLTEDARRVQKEEDDLLEAYKARQEEMLEQERRMEEEMARKEQERVEKLRFELEKRKEEERKRMDDLERQRKERELALQKEKEAFEKEMRMKMEKEKEIEVLKKRQMEEERKRIEQKGLIKDGGSKTRLPNTFETSLEQGDLEVDVSEKLPQPKSERQLSEKHREFVEDAANTAAFQVQKIQNRERMADKSREIKQRQLEAKADLDAVRLQTSRLAEPSNVEQSDMREVSSFVRSPTHNVTPIAMETDKTNIGNSSHVPGVSSDWSTSSEDDVPLPRVKTPLSSSDRGVGSSLTPELQSVNRPSLLHSMPLFSSSPAVMEGSSPLAVQLKSSLRDSKRQIETTQEKLILAETKVKQLENHADELQSKLEELIHQKSAVERDLFDITEDNRLLKHECSRALEDKKIAEALVDTVKDQLGRSEEKLTREIKLRRTIEEASKQLELDRLNLENALRHVSQDQEDLRKALEREQEQCRLKDELYKEQKKQNEEIIVESQKVSQHRADVLTRLESVDENRKHVEANSESLRTELVHAKSEVTRLNSQLETVTKLSQNELESLKKQLAEQTEKSRRLEDILAKVRSEYDTQVSQLQTTNNDQQNKLENEVAARHGLQSELAVLRSRLESTENERDEANKTRIETDRQLHSLREEMYRSKSNMEKELSSLRETYQLSNLKLTTAENKISSLDAELQTANIMLAERSNQMSINIRDIDNKRASVSKLEAELRTEKEANARLSAKLEAASEKVKDVESEAANLRRQLEVASERVRRYEETSQENRNKLHSTITEIKTDYEKTKGKMTEKERNLAEVVEKYKEEIQQNVSKMRLQDDNIRNLQQELAETTRKFSAAEASLEIQLKARENLEEERDHLREMLRNYEGQMTAKINENQIINGHASVLQNELEHSRKVSDETSQRLAATSYDLESLEKIKGKTRLESLLSQIKSSNIELEEKLQAETFTRSHHAREAEEAKGLWESEVRARSKLGAKIIEMENKLNETKAAVEEEKRKTRKALESRKILQGKLDVYEKRSDQHTKEVQALKTQIKGYKRRLKEFETTEKRIPAIQAEFNKEMNQYEGNITSLRNQLRDVNEKLREEGDLRILAERKRQENERELTSAKAQAKEQSRHVQKLERRNRQMEDDMEHLKEQYKDNFIEKAELNRMKMDLEAKSRIELNRKLADVNAHLEEQAVAREVLERSRNEQEALKFKEMENTILRLKREVEQYRSNFQQLQTEKETMEVEAERFKDMYESEARRKEKLNNLLFQEREKSAESKALLNLERSRSSKLVGNGGINTSFLDRSPGVPRISKHESMNSRSPGLIYAQPKEKLMESVDRELGKSIQRHLDTLSSNSPANAWTTKEINMTSSPLAASSSQYMETLKRNYFV